MHQTGYTWRVPFGEMHIKFYVGQLLCLKLKEKKNSSTEAASNERVNSLIKYDKSDVCCASEGEL